jgi:hypothetical protein
MLAGIFTSCKVDKTDPNVSSSDGSNTINPTDTSEVRLTPDVPEGIQFNGHKFTVITRGKSSSTWYSMDIDAEGTTGEPVNDAVYARNIKIEQLYNVEIIEDAPKSPEVVAENELMSQNDIYDMICLRMNGHISSLVTKGYLMDLNELEYLDLTRPYYDQRSIADLSIANKNFAITGDLLTMGNDATRAIMFNKTIAEQINIEGKYNASLYDLVKSGKWTLDVLFECSQLAVQDKDGMPGMNPDMDVFGMQTEPFNTLVFLHSAGVKIVTKDSNDIPQYSLINDRATDVLQKVIPMQNDISMMLNTKYSGYTPDVWVGLFHPTFAGGRSLFYMGQVQNAKMFRIEDVDFGILPIPKYEESQLEYLSPVTTYGANSIAVPKIASDVDRTGIIIEALSCESKYTVQPAYYESTLKGKTAKDEESSDMLDIMFSNRIFDLGYMYNWGSAYTVISNLTTANTINVASQLKGIDKTVQGAITATIQAITKND